MVERQRAQIEIIGEAPSKRDYCYMVFDEAVRNNLSGLLELERQLSLDLSYSQREEAIVAHIRLWNKLPDYFKGQLADLTGVYSDEII